LLKKFFKSLNQKGQSLALYALLVPLMFTVGGAAVDLGWVYMNFSTLQNAADAAAVAGAKEFQSESEIEPALVSNYPADEVENIGGEVAEKKITADKNADDYLKLNLKNNLPESKTFLYKDGENNLYYVVQLTEKNFEHLFDFMNSLHDTKISATSTVKLTYYQPPPQDEAPAEVQEDLPQLKAINVISGNWELEAARSRNKWKAPTENLDNFFVNNAAENFYSKSKIWLNYNSSTNSYTTGNFYRSATVNVDPGKGRLRTGGDSTETKPDSLVLGFRQDIVRVKSGGLEVQNGTVKKVGSVVDTIFEKDWDIRRDSPYNRKTEVRYINPTKYWDASCDLRIHNIYNFNTPFDVRPEKIAEDKNNPFDILWIRIESEAFLPLTMLGITDKPNHFQFKSVRQIILNINCDNTVKDAETEKYKYRPLVFFYDGPERFNMNSAVRNPKPIVLNLNADFRGILFAPSTSVIINDNGHKFYGFIVAKEYRKLVENSAGHKVTHKKSNAMWINDYGEIFTEQIDRMNCGTYDTLGIVSFGDYDYEVEEHSQNNLLTI